MMHRHKITIYNNFWKRKNCWSNFISRSVNTHTSLHYIVTPRDEIDMMAFFYFASVEKMREVK